MGYTPASAFVDTAGDTMTGPLILSADPSAPLGSATKQYVDGKTSPPEVAVQAAEPSAPNILLWVDIDAAAGTTGFEEMFEEVMRLRDEVAELRARVGGCCA